MISVDKLIEEYLKTDNKEECLKSHIINNYVNYEDKVSECKKIVELTMYLNVNGKQIFKASSTTRHYLYNIRLLALYTDIELTENNNLSDYNKLNKENILIHLYSLLPETEMAEFRMILQMCIDDEFENYRSMVSFLETKIDSLNIMFDALENASKSYFPSNIVNKD